MVDILIVFLTLFAGLATGNVMDLALLARKPKYRLSELLAAETAFATVCAGALAGVAAGTALRYADMFYADTKVTTLWCLAFFAFWCLAWALYDYIHNVKKS